MLNRTGERLLSTLAAVALCSCPTWVYPQEEATAEFVYQIRADCDGADPKFGTGFISSDLNAIVTSLHVVDDACTIRAFKPDTDATAESEQRDFDALCVGSTSVTDDLALLTSSELDDYIRGGPSVGYRTRRAEDTPLPRAALAFGYSQGSPSVVPRRALSVNSRRVLKDLVFRADRPQWIACGSPSVDNVYYRLEGIAASGDSGAPVFLQGDNRVLGVISGGRAMENVTWAATMKAPDEFQSHACPGGGPVNLRPAVCHGLEYFYGEREETAQRLLYGIPLTERIDDRPPTPIEPAAIEPPPPWYVKGWVWAAAAAVIAGVTIAVMADDDGGDDDEGDVLLDPPTLTIPLP